MRFTFAAVFSTVLALAASQSTTGTTGTSASSASAPAPTASYGPNYFTPPVAGYLLRAGQPFTFKWVPTTGGTVTLTLRNGANGNLNPGTVIAGNIDNSGSYTFTPPTDITPDVSYTVEISDDQDPSLVNYTQQFDITNDNPPSSTASATGSSTGTTPASTFGTISGTTPSGAATSTSGSSASASGSTSASASNSSGSASATGSSSASGSTSPSGTSSATPSSSTIQSTNDAAGLKVGGSLMAAVLVVAVAL